MNDLISRSALIEELKNINVMIDYGALKKLVDNVKDEDVLNTIIEYAVWQTSEIALQHINNQPTVEPVRGEWIDTQPEYHHGTSSNAHKCSICGDYYTTEPEDLFFCPRCGADMRGEKNERN